MIRNGSYLGKEILQDNHDNTNAIKRIEHAEREMPFCDCGQPMTPVGREDGSGSSAFSNRTDRQPDGHSSRRFPNTGHSAG